VARFTCSIAISLALYVQGAMIEPDELPDDIGLIYYNPDKETLYTQAQSHTQRD